MNENEPDILLSLLFLASVGILFGVNYFYQRKARFYADEILKDNPKEFNKQIKANAYRNLFSSLLWAFLVFLVFVWNYDWIISTEYNLGTVLFFAIDLLFSIFLIFWGIRGYRSQMKRIVELP